MIDKLFDYVKEHPYVFLISTLAAVILGGISVAKDDHE